MIELPRHQVLLVLDDHGVDLAQRHAARRLETEQAAADHDGAARPHGARDQLFDVVEIAKAEHAVQLAPRNRRDVRPRAETEHELRVAPAPAELVLDRLCGPVDGDDALTVVLGDRRAGRKDVRLIDASDLDLAGEERRQLDAIVGPPTLGVEQNNGESAPGNLVGRAQSRRSATDDDDRVALRVSRRAIALRRRSRQRARAERDDSRNEGLTAWEFHQPKSFMRGGGYELHRLRSLGRPFTVRSLPLMPARFRSGRRTAQSRPPGAQERPHPGRRRCLIGPRLDLARCRQR